MSQVLCLQDIERSCKDNLALNNTGEISVPLTLSLFNADYQLYVEVEKRLSKINKNIRILGRN